MLSRNTREDRLAQTALVVSAHSADFVWRAGGAIALHVGVEDVAHLLHRHPAQRCEPARMRQWRRQVQGERALGDVGGVVADALDVGSDAQRGQDHPQVTGQRATPDEVDHVLIDPAFQRVDGLVVGDDALGGAVVAARHHVQPGLQLRCRHLAHADQLVQQRALLVVVALDDVVVLFVHQPNLPVM